MLAKSIGKKYACALYGIAEERNSVEICKDALFYFADSMDKTAFDAFNNPKLSLDNKQVALRKHFGVREKVVPAEFANFLCLLIEKKRFGFLPEIRAEFKMIYDAKHGFSEAKVKSAFPVDEIQKENIKRALENRYKCSYILEFSVDPSLIGGLVITMGSEMIDGSLKSRLAKIKTLLLK